MAQRNWTSSESYPGVRWWVDEARPRLKGGRFDRQYGIRYTVLGKRYEVVLGWASEGMTEAKAADERGRLIAQAKEGREATKKEEREATLRERREQERRAKAEERKNVTLREYAEQEYFPVASMNWKPDTARKAREHVVNWIDPATKDAPMRELGVEHVKRIVANLARAGRSPRTVQYVLRTFAMIWAAARDAGIVDKPCPTKARSVKTPKIDNERQRYLTSEEAEHLLACVRVRSPQAADMALVALEAGLRFSEVAGLTWGAVDVESGVLRVLNTKGKRDRYVPMTSKLKGFFAAREQGKANALVFPNSEGEIQAQVPSGFWRGLADSRLNEDVEDAKLRVGFHVLRHSYASRLVQQGVDLYRVQRLLGHSTPTLTARYAKLADDDLREAVQQMETREKMKGKPGKVVELLKTAGGE